MNYFSLKKAFITIFCYSVNCPCIRRSLCIYKPKKTYIYSPGMSHYPVYDIEDGMLNANYNTCL